MASSCHLFLLCNICPEEGDGSSGAAVAYFPATSPPRRKRQQLPSPFTSLQDLPQKKAMVVVVAFFFFATTPQ
jgi:hypothetical protein